jgi:hypothetical protein
VKLLNFLNKSRNLSKLHVYEKPDNCLNSAVLCEKLFKKKRKFYIIMNFLIWPEDSSFCLSGRLRTGLDSYR